MLLIAGGVVLVLTRLNLWTDGTLPGRFHFSLLLVAAVFCLAAALGGIVGAASKERSVSFLSSIFALVAITIYPALYWYLAASSNAFDPIFYFDFAVEGNLRLTVYQFACYFGLAGLLFDLIALSIRYIKRKSMRPLALIGCVFYLISGVGYAFAFWRYFEFVSFPPTLEQFETIALDMCYVLAIVLVAVGSLVLSKPKQEKKKEEEPRLNLDGEEEDKDVIVVE